MSYADNGCTSMFILNNEWQPTWQLHNARGHVALAMGAENNQELKLRTYEVPALNHTTPISTWPVIDKATSEKELHKLYEKLLDAKLKCYIFTDSMFGSSAQVQMEQTKNATDPKILVLGIFGPTEEIRNLTKHLSLARF